VAPMFWLVDLCNAQAAAVVRICDNAEGMGCANIVVRLHDSTFAGLTLPLLLLLPD